MRRIGAFLAVLSAVSLFVGIAPGLATPMLQLSDGSSTITITDGLIGDQNSTAGVVTFIGTIGVWNINVSTGISNSPVPNIDLNSVNSSTGAGFLNIKFWDIDFSLGAGPQVGSIFAGIGGTSVGTVDFQTGYRDDNDNTQDSCVNCSSVGSASGIPFSGTLSMPISVTDTFWLGLGVNITHAGAGTTSFDFAATVPEPLTLVLLGSGLLGIIAIRRKL